MNEMVADGTAPEPCIETAIDLLRNNAEIRVGKHTFTRPSDILECMGTNLGMSLAVLAALVTTPHSALFPASPLARLSHPRRQEKTPCAQTDPVQENEKDDEDRTPPDAARVCWCFSVTA